jgi:exonuclease III
MKKHPNPTPITKPVKEVLAEHIEVNIMFMNVNSIVSEEKRQKTRYAILERKPDIVILAETKVKDEDPEFQTDGYWLVAQINRKADAGGMLVLAKDTIDIQSASAVSVVKEVQVVSFDFNGYFIIGVYRSPTILGPPVDQHRKLIEHLSKLINKMPPETPYIITGDFNLPELAACDFRPVPKLFDYTDIFDNQKATINQMWGDFFQKYNLGQHVTEASRATSDNILDLVITPKTQDIPYLKVDQSLFS